MQYVQTINQSSVLDIVMHSCDIRWQLLAVTFYLIIKLNGNPSTVFKGS